MEAAAVHSARTKRLTLLASILGSSIVFIDGTVVNVALPAIARDLDAGLSGRQWVVEAYLLVLSSLLLVGGSLGDLLGRRRIFALGVGAFGATSLLCAIAPSVAVLTVARALQGAAALLVPSTLAILIAVVPPEERGAAIGSWTAWGGVSTVVGPLAGGLLVQLASWRWIFLVRLVPVALTLFLIWHAVPSELDAREPGHVDFLGAALCALGLAGIVFALVEQSAYGWTDARIAVPLAGGAVLVALFLAQERRSPSRCCRSRSSGTQLRRRQRRDADHLRGARRRDVLPAPLPPAGRRLYRPRRRSLAAAPDGDHVPALKALRRAGRSRRPARSDERRPADRRRRPAPCSFAWTRARTTSRACCPLRSSLAWGCRYVAPLTAAVLAGADEHHAGVASGVNNAIARVAGLLAIGAVGAVVSAQFASTLDARVARAPLSTEGMAAVAKARDRPLSSAGRDGVSPAERARLGAAIDDASVSAFRAGMLVAGGLVIAGGAISLAGVRNPRCRVAAEECPGGALCGASEDLGHSPLPAVPVREPEPART